MTQQDASFSDGQEKPLNIAALEGEGLQVIAALAQDAVFPISEMRWLRKSRQFALLVNRFRWELPQSAASTPERVQSLLAFENVLSVASQGIDRSDEDVVLSLLSISYDGNDETGGTLTLVLAGDGAIRLNVEALECRLKDVTKPYKAPSGSVPSHQD